MKILAISASPRGDKSRTLELVEAMAQGARAAGAEVEVVDVCKLRILYCTGCGACYVTGKCPLRDDFAALFQKILACDGLVLGSPNYFHTVTAQLKTVFDRMADTVHCQLLAGKYGCAVGTAGGPAHGEVTAYLEKILGGFGVTVVGSVGTSPMVPGALDAALGEAKTVGRGLAEAIRTKRAYPEQEAQQKATRDFFKHLVSLNKDIWRHEYEYWRALGEL